MKKQSLNMFFLPLITKLGRKTKSIGIILDKDGTIELYKEQGEKFKKTIEYLRNTLGFKTYIVINTGRSVQEMIGLLKDDNIPHTYFDYIIGTDGAFCMDIKTGKYLFKNEMNHEKAEDVIRIFQECGGIPSNVRFTDDEGNIHTEPTEEIQKYYKKIKGNRPIVFKKDTTDIEDFKIAKLTFAGTHDVVQRFNERINEELENECLTHITTSKFPTGKEKSYIIDVTRSKYERTSS